MRFRFIHARGSPGLAPGPAAVVLLAALVLLLPLVLLALVVAGIYRLAGVLALGLQRLAGRIKPAAADGRRNVRVIDRGHPV